MDQRRVLMAIGGVIFLLLLVVFGVAYFSSKNKPKAPARRTVTASASPTSLTVPVASSVPTAGSQGTPTTPDTSGTKLFSGSNFSLRYPNAWGLLKCSNSANFELDPENATDQPNVVCNVAVKPITVLVSRQALTCQGDTVQLGYNQVVRSKTPRRDGGTTYRWCVNGRAASLDITNRVSSTGAPATSKEDYSSAVEQMISTLNFAVGS